MNESKLERVERVELWTRIFCQKRPPKWYGIGDVEYDLVNFKKSNPHEYELLVM